MGDSLAKHNDKTSMSDEYPLSAFIADDVHQSGGRFELLTFSQATACDEHQAGAVEDVCRCQEASRREQSAGLHAVGAYLRKGFLFRSFYRICQRELKGFLLFFLHPLYMPAHPTASFGSCR